MSIRASRVLISTHKGIIVYHYRRQIDTFPLHNDLFHLLDMREANEPCKSYAVPFLYEVSACHAGVGNDAIVRSN